MIDLITVATISRDKINNNNNIFIIIINNTAFVQLKLIYTIFIY